jgi:hypothetical protein
MPRYFNVKCVIGFEKKKTKGLNRIAKKEKKMAKVNHASERRTLILKIIT